MKNNQMPGIIEQGYYGPTMKMHPTRELSRNDDINMDNIYLVYRDAILPALVSSLPILLEKMRIDSMSFINQYSKTVLHFLIPWTKEDFQWNLPTPQVQTFGNITQFLLRSFDSNNDGQISPHELLQGNFDALQESILSRNGQFHSPRVSLSFFHLTSWPLIDYNLGVLLWRSCGGLLVLIIAASIIPGRIHGLAGRILRWPLLILTYLTVTTELFFYVLVRLTIRMLEASFSTKKHRGLRKSLSKARSYDEWVSIARDLDISQGRTEWQNRIDDETSYRYNWVFINELIGDLKEARASNSFIQTLLLLQQCTKNNVGGVMNEDLFSYTNSGEPKKIVKEFIEEVVKSVVWLTNECRVVTEASLSGKLPLSDTNEVNPHIPRIIVDKRNIIDHVIDHSRLLIDPVARVLQSVSGHEEDGEDKVIIRESFRDKKEIQSSVVYDKSLIEDQKSVDNRKGNFYRQELRAKVKVFLKRARAAYGRTALCLSGGAMMGCYHFGHVKALFDEGVLPHIISGTSAGSVIAAMVCTRTDAEIERDFKAEVLCGKLSCFEKKWPDRFRFLYEHGSLFDQNDWLELIQFFACGNMTFEEAYYKTGRILNITLSATTKKAPPILVNYITAPDVTIASAIVASAAVPGIINPVRLMKKGPDGVVRHQAQNKDEEYFDGSIDQDIPISGLAEMFNCQFFLTAQCNPHIVPFFFNAKGCVGQPSRWKRGDDSSWRGGFLLTAIEIYLRSDMKSKFQFLHELEAAIGFTSTMFTQSSYGGTTTIVPRVSFSDYFQLFSNPSLLFLKKCFQVGSVAAYQHCAMIKLHFSVSKAVDKGLAVLEDEDGSLAKPRRRMASLLASQRMNKGKGISLNSSTIPFSVLKKIKDGSVKSENSTESTDESMFDDECEMRGFDGVQMDFEKLSETLSFNSKEDSIH